MSDKVISINIKKSGDIEINICQSDNSEIEDRKESEKSITKIIAGVREELEWNNPLISKSK